MKSITFLLSLILAFPLLGQTFEAEQLEGLKFRNIGPAGMSGRITAIDVNLRDKDHIYVGAASGGVWESKNGGINWKPIFDEQPTQSIGAIKINQANPDEIWVGTGEGNPRNSHNSGAGIYKSIDGGKTWTYMGLKETKLIHRIVINKFNPNQIVVGALGSAWGPSKDRGIYITNDGGKTWKQSLFVGNEVGVADLVVDPSNPNKLLAAMWEFGRSPWNFNSGGKGSGLYLSYDGGYNWKKITSKEGLPKGDLGRMGLAFAPSNPDIVYALVEAKKNGLYKSTDGGEKWSLVSTKNIGNRPFYYAELYVDPKNENRIYNLWSYVSKSEDGGKTFKTIMDYGNSIHPDHHALWIDPDDPNYLINGNDGGLNISRDGAKTWRFVTNLPVGQFYHVDVDSDFPYNVYGGMQDNGSWVGPAFSLKRGGIINADWQELYFGDGFDVAARRDDNRYGYAMSQQGNLGLWDKVTGKTEYIQPQHPTGEELRYNWNAAMSLDPFNDEGIYYGSQFVHHSQDAGKSWKIISPDLTTNDTLKQDQSKSGGLTLDVTGAESHTTILCISPSPYDDQVLWVGTDDGNIQVSKDGGANWNEVSNRLSGLPQNAWIAQIEYSPTNDKELFVVANNYRMNDWSAYVYHSRDGGLTWKRIVDDNDVASFACSIVQDPKNDDLIFLGTDVGLYFSLDHGSKWHKWTKGLPSVQIRDMKIQEEFGDLVLGTFGRAFWILDDLEPLRELAADANILKEELKIFNPYKAYLTHSRSYQGIRFVGQGDFKGDNKRRGALLTLWQKPKEEKAEKPNAMPKDKKKKSTKKKKDKAKESKGVDNKTKKGDKKKDDNKKGGKKKKDKAKFIVIDQQGDTIRQFTRKLKPGMNRISWMPNRKGVEFPRREAPKEKREPGGMPILPGSYKLIVQKGTNKDSTQLEVALDPRIDDAEVDTETKARAIKNYYSKVETVTKAYNNLKEAKKALALHQQIIDIQEDSLKKEVAEIKKTISGDLDSLMNLYMLPESDKVQYRDSSNTLNSQLRKGRQFLGTSQSGPSPNGSYAIAKAERRMEEVLVGINTFFASDWKNYIAKLKTLSLDLFKEYDALKIE